MTDPSAPRVRVAVGEMPPDLRAGTPEWDDLAERLAATQADLVVLNELPFGPWLPSSDDFDQGAFDAAVEAHDQAIERLGELGVPNVVGSRLTVQDGRRVNAGFVWRRGQGVEDVYTKQHVPNSMGYYEQAWYEPGPRDFPLFEVAGLTVGMLICTDVMFNEHARHYGRAGAQLIAVPRAMPPVTAGFFDAALTMAAVASGAYVASSNRGGFNDQGEAFEGRGAVYNPAGQHVAQTNMLSPIDYCDLDLGMVAIKQALYPCDVPE